MAETLVFQLLNAMVWSWVLALLALGLTLVFGYLDIVNVAHGALYAIGAAVSWWIIQATGAPLGGFLLSLVVAPIVVALIGIVAFQTTLRPIEKQPPIYTLITTFGLFFVLQHALFLIFGGAPRSVDLPVATLIPLLDRTYPLYRILMACGAAAIIAGLWYVLHHSTYGTWIRAVQQNRDVATAMGIPARQVTLVVFAAGCGLAGLAGVLAAPVLQVRYDMGIDIIIDAFIVVIAAGFGNILGTIIVALIYQLVQGVMVMMVTPVQGKVLALSLVLAWVLIRRKGLLEREKRR